jgi:hypothetical protein
MFTARPIDVDRLGACRMMRHRVAADVVSFSTGVINSSFQRLFVESACALRGSEA